MTDDNLIKSGKDHEQSPPLPQISSWPTQTQEATHPYSLGNIKGKTTSLHYSACGSRGGPSILQTCKPTNLLWQMRRLLNKYLLIAWTDKIIHNLTAWHRVSLKDISSPSIFMFQLKCTPTLLATPGPVQINNSSTRWNSNEDKQLWVLSAPPGHWHTKLPFITCCKIFYSHLPHANEGAHVYSWGELQTTFHSIGWLSEPKEWAEQG